MADLHGGMLPFRDDEAKLRFLFTPQSIHLSTPLPCSNNGCLNMAVVATADYNLSNNTWVVIPTCRECIARMYKDNHAQAQTEVESSQT